MSHEELSRARAELDALDRELVALLARRARVVGALLERKRALGIAPRDRARERALLEERAAWGEAAGLAGGAVKAVFRGVLGVSRALLRSGR